MARVWAHSQRKDGELLVMLALADFANDAGESWPSIPVLAAKARLTDRQARRVLIKLEQAREIRCVKSNGGRNRRNHYFICLSENPDNITLTKLQGKNTSVKKYTGIEDTKTLTPMSGALNHHGTINKREATELASLIPDSPLSTKSKRKQRRVASIPTDLQLTVSRVVAKINELGGTHYHDDRPDALRNLIARLNDGRTEVECLAVVESRHAAWTGNDKMLEYFRPSTLFASAHFEDYLQAAQRQGNGNGHAPSKVEFLDNGTVKVDGFTMSRADYERRNAKRQRDTQVY
jgi:uncharacterized phage protein (TIGR02220 family)